MLICNFHFDERAFRYPCGTAANQIYIQILQRDGEGSLALRIWMVKQPVLNYKIFIILLCCVTKEEHLGILTLKML